MLSSTRKYIIQYTYTKQIIYTYSVFLQQQHTKCVKARCLFALHAGAAFFFAVSRIVGWGWGGGTYTFISHVHRR